MWQLKVKVKEKITSGMGFTLAELMIAIVLCSVAMAAAMGGYNFLFVQIKSNIERSNVNLQMAYALESIKLHTLSAIAVKDGYTLSDTSLSRNDLCFRGEKDIYNITPSKDKDNLDYCYYRDTRRNIIRNATDTNGAVTNETLIDGKYDPQITFSYESGNEPNVLTVAINATAMTGRSDTQVYKKESMRLWFANIKE